MREFQCNNMVMELVREISRVDTKELARDSSGTRSYSLFLVELAERSVKTFVLLWACSNLSMRFNCIEQ